MFVNQRLVYLQLQKTGSTHVAMLLDRLIGGEQIGKHNRLPASLRAARNLVVGSIRSPWDWYVSLWGFGCDDAGGLAGRLTAGVTLRGHGYGRHPVHAVRALAHEIRRSRTTWARLYSDVEDPRLFRQWLAMIHDPRNRYALGEQYARSSISTFSGFLTYRYAFLYSAELKALYSSATGSPEKLAAWLENQCVLDCTIRKEHLETDLLGALRRCEFLLDEDQINLIRSAGRTNVSSRRPELQFYYDAQTIELVGTRDRYLVDKYGYTAPILVP